MTTNESSRAPTLNRQILDEASAWFVDFRVGDVALERRAEFDLWLRQSPEHIRAYLEIAGAYHDLSALSSEQVAELSERISLAPDGQNIVRLAPKTSADVTTTRAPQSRRWISASIAAAAAAVGVAVWIAFPKYPSYSTGVGEGRTVTMADGSTITLNSLTRIRVRYTKTERLIDLLSGQAYFRVLANANRPFIVHSGFAVVKDVGTQFDVDHSTTSTTVTVVEGQIVLYSAKQAPTMLGTEQDPGLELSPDGASDVAGTRANGSATPPQPRASASSPGILLAAGEQAVVSEHEISTRDHANIGAATAWLKHNFIFNGSHLRDVVDQFNRYNARQIVIDSVALDDFRISGVYSSTDPDSFLLFLRAQPGIEVTQANGAMHISKK